MSTPVTVGSAIAYLDLDTSRFTSGVTRAESALNSFESVSKGVTGTLDKVGKTLTKTGTAMTTAVTLPLLGMGTASFQLASSFEASMSKVQAISGATTEELDALYNKAIEMGAATKFSAQESADAFTYMAMAGWDAEEMIAGIAGIMDLAAADGLDLATTSDIVTDALTAFGLQASDSAHFADVLAQASSSANTNVYMLGESFKYIGPIAGSLGFSIEDVALALGIMANSGIKGSQAGTALRASLAAMSKPTDEAAHLMEELGIEISNSDGSMKSLMEIMEILREAFAGLTEAEQANVAATLFGREAMSGMLSIINSSEEDFYGLAEAINNADGRAQEMAGTMMDNVSGSLEQLMGALESLAIKVGSLLTPVIKKVTDFITSIVEKLNQMSDEEAEQILKIAAVAAAIGPLLIALGGIVTTLSSVIGGISFFITMTSAMSSAIAIVAGVLGGILMPLGALVAGLTSMGFALKSVFDEHEGFRTKVLEIWENLKKKVEVVKDVFNKFLEGAKNVFEYIKSIRSDEFSSIGDSLLTLMDAFKNLYNTLEPVIKSLGKLIGGTFIVALTAFISAAASLMTAIAPMINMLAAFIQGLSDMINFYVSLFSGDLGAAEEYAQSFVAGLKVLLDNVIAVFVNMATQFTENFPKILRMLFEQFGVSVDEVKAKIKENIKTFIEQAIEDGKQFLQEAPTKFGVWLGEMVVKLQQFGSDVLTWIREQFPIWISSAKEFLVNLPSKLWGHLMNLVNKVKELGPEMMGSGENIMEKLWEGLKKTWEKIKSWFEEVKEAIKEFLSGITEGYNKAKTTAAAAGVGSLGGSHANGLSYVPYNGYIAELHQGERVLTRAENEAYNRGTGTSGDTFIFNSPKAIDEYEASRLLRQTKEDLNRDYS